MYVDPLLGTLLAGTYRVKRLLGRGAMGAVYVAEHEALSRTVAIKVLAPSIAEQPAAVERLNREAKAAAKLVHPNIAGVTDFRATPGEPAFLVMEYIEGVSLETAMEQGAMPQSRVAGLGVQLLGALGVAHAAGVVHRDIKPANMMLVTVPGAGEMVRVLDFGIAKVAGTHALTAEGSLLGSPLYMAPEQAFSDVIDGRADLYATAATLYHAACGYPPLDADTLPRLLMMIRDTVPMPLASRAGHLSAEFGAVIDRALCKQPRDRYADAAEMREALLPFCGELGAPLSRVNSAAVHATTQMADSNVISASAMITRGSLPPPSQEAATGHAGAAYPGAAAVSYGAAGSLGGAAISNASTGNAHAAAPAGVAHTQPGSKPRRAPVALIGAAVLTLAAGAFGAWRFTHTPSAAPVMATNTPSTNLSGAVAAVDAPVASSVQIAPTSPVAAAATALAADAVPTTTASALTASSAVAAASAAVGAKPGAVANAATPTTAAPAAAAAKPKYRVSCYVSSENNYAKNSDVSPSGAALGGRLQQCAPLGCYERSRGRTGGEFFEYYDLAVDASGRIGAVSHPGDSCKAMDSCAFGALRGAALATPEVAGKVQISCTFREGAAPVSTAQMQLQ